MAKAQPSDSGLQELKTELKQKKLGRLYFFHGEETFLLNHYLTQMRKLALDPLTESFNYHRLNQETFDMQSYRQTVRPRVVLLQEVTALFGRRGGYFFFVCKNRPMMPTIKMPIWIRSEYVTIRSTPSLFSEIRGLRSYPRKMGANRLPLLVAP